MSRSSTTTMTKDGVEYELELVREDSQTTVTNVTILSGLGVERPEFDIDPDEFMDKLKDHEWEQLDEVFK